MKSFILDKFNNKNFSEFIQFFNGIPDDEVIEIYVNSSGGQSIIKDNLVRLINNNPNRFKLIGNVAYSAAFVLLLESNCDIYIVDHGVFMHHKGGMEVYIRDGHSFDSDLSKFQKKVMENYSSDISFLNEEQLKDYNDGKDIYFDSGDVAKIFSIIGKTYNIKTESWTTVQKKI